MKGFKEKNFADRLQEAAEARKAALERFKARPAADDPEVVKRREERAAIAAAREARTAARKAAKEAEAAARAEQEAIERTEREARERREAIEKLIRDSAEAAERKAARDARYAARKARQKRRSRCHPGPCLRRRKPVSPQSSAKGAVTPCRLLARACTPLSGGECRRNPGVYNPYGRQPASVAHRRVPPEGVSGG